MLPSDGGGDKTLGGIHPDSSYLWEGRSLKQQKKKINLPVCVCLWASRASSFENCAPH